MQATDVTTLFLIALGTSLALRLWLNERQIRSVTAHRDRVPEPFAGRIELAAHQKAADYTLANARFGRWVKLFDAVVLLGWTLGGGLQWSHDLAAGAGLGPLATGVLTVLLVGLIGAALNMPFQLYDTFVIEARFGFNRMTWSIWVQDVIKGAMLALALGTPAVAMVLWFMEAAGTWWWLYAWGGWMAFSLLLTLVFPTWIAPLFNKFSPLDDKDLERDVVDLLQRSGFRSRGVYVMDGSRRSSHGNAYFTGFGNSKRIVFFDTLLASLERRHILAVLAHELGHFKHRHIVKGLIVSAITSLAGFAVLAWLLPQVAVYEGLGVAKPTTDLALLLFVMVTPTFTYFVQPVFAWWSRHHEYEADAYAAQQSSAVDLSQALVRLYRDNASTLTPDALYSAFYDSHPPALARIRHLETLAPA